MEKYIDINENGYSVRCKLFYQKDFRNIPNLVICTHGFGGNKENHSAAKFAQQLITKYKGYGVLVFDWPCHGADARKKLVLEEFMTYLTLVVDYARKELHATTLYNYSASFGAYLTLKYMAEIGNPFKKGGPPVPGDPHGPADPELPEPGRDGEAEKGQGSPGGLRTEDEDGPTVPGRSGPVGHPEV